MFSNAGFIYLSEGIVVISVGNDISNISNVIIRYGITNCRDHSGNYKCTDQPQSKILSLDKAPNISYVNTVVALNCVCSAVVFAVDDAGGIDIKLMCTGSWCFIVEYQ